MKSINTVEIPNNATNGDIIKTLFSNHCLKMWTDYKQMICFDFEDVKYWWNSPYEGGISNEVCD